MQYSNPPPPYAAPISTPRARPTISTLPIFILHRIISYTLDPRLTPSKWSGDPAEERARRIWALFKGLRGVNRRFYLVSTAILRNYFLPIWNDLLPANCSSDPMSDEGQALADDETLIISVFTTRGRETAVYDRFIAIRVGEDLRKIESGLYEESEAEGEVFRRLQPVARMEDLLLTLPTTLVSPTGTPGQRGLPLYWHSISMNLTPSWAQVHVYGERVRGKELVIEVRRMNTPEGTVKRIGEGLEDIGRGLVVWGGRA